MKKNLIKHLEIFQSQAVIDCLRANEDTLRDELNITTAEQCKKLLINKNDELLTQSDWDDIHWHAGYVRGLQDAINLITK